jgi:predicted DNA-binding protein (UPF0251 family)
MSICTKCGIDKPLDQYQTYWHSTQQTTRTRRYCKSCYREQKRIYRNSINMKEIIQPEVLELQPEPIKEVMLDKIEKKCRICLVVKDINEFYLKDGKPIFGSCKSCECDKSKVKRQEEIVNKGGSWKVFTEPNKYADELQKRGTFQIMEVLGYLYHEESGIWTKEGWKEVVDNQPHFIYIKKSTVKKKQTRTNITEEVKNRIVYYYLRGHNQQQISHKLEISDTTIWRILKEKNLLTSK